ncbi:MAG: tetratricopeptide repeat-containing sulfotransferase family protein [Rhizomicrobium sp.]
MSGTTEQTGTLPAALAQAAKLLGPRPDLAAEQAREILKAVPHHPQALLFLGTALRKLGDFDGAIAILEPLAQTQPRSADVQYQFGLALSDKGDTQGAIRALTKTVRINGKHALAWCVLAEEKMLLGDEEGAQEANARHIEASVNNPALIEAAVALRENRLAVAERMLRPYLKELPTDVTAIRMLAEIAARLRRYDEAEKLLARALHLAPGFTSARHNYASVLYRNSKPAAAIAQTDILLKDEPRNPGYKAIRAAALSLVGEYEEAIRTFQDLLKTHPDQPKAWMSYGHVLKTTGRQAECIAAYRRSIAQRPSLGEAYWSLANLKTFRFTPDDIAAMRAQLARTDIDDEDRFHLDFALGKALEDAGDYRGSFEHYTRANALRRKSQPYFKDHTERFARRLKSVYMREFFDARKDAGFPAPDPIFIVGLPRSGSTLIEQILSSHSQVEGTMELHDIGQMTRELGKWARKTDDDSYPEIVSELPLERFQALGEEYLERTRIHRKLGRPFFIDKMPNNFLHAGFIHMILPNAKVIDARRHPLGCCLSCFKQHFARGQAFSYGLEDTGHYYAEYVSLMAHYDAVLPGRIHRIVYEDMVASPETQIRGLLEYCGLPFEESCLRFYENDRAVRTASSEQVRRPIYRDATDHWQNFEPWLGPLKDALGPVLPAYPGIPVF